MRSRTTIPPRRLAAYTGYRECLLLFVFTAFLRHGNWTYNTRFSYDKNVAVYASHCKAIKSLHFLLQEEVCTTVTTYGNSLQHLRTVPTTSYFLGYTFAWPKLTLYSHVLFAFFFFSPGDIFTMIVQPYIDSFLNIYSYFTDTWRRYFAN